MIVNEAFARRFMNGASPVGRRVRYAIADAAAPEEWLEIVGVVRDIGTSPTDLGEAPFVFHAARPRTMSPLTMGIRVGTDPSTFSERVRAIASTVDPGLRLEEMRRLDDWMWRIDLPAMVSASALAGVVALGLFLSAAGIFSLMSVTVARRTREIGLRSALGASTRAAARGDLLARRSPRRRRHRCRKSLHPARRGDGWRGGDVVRAERPDANIGGDARRWIARVC